MHVGRRRLEPGGRRRVVGQGLVLAYGVGFVLVGYHTLHGHVHAGGLGLTGHWLRDATMALPAALAVAYVVELLSGSLGRWAGLDAQRPILPVLRALGSAWGYALVVIPSTAVHAALFPIVSTGAAGHHGEPVEGAGVAGFLADAAGNAAVAMVSGLLLLLALPPMLHLAQEAVRRLRLPVARRRLVVCTALPAMVTALLAVPVVTDTGLEPAEAAAPQCNASTQDRSYDVAAINVHMVFNRWGQQNPHAQVYVLQHDKAAVRDWHRPLAETNSKRRLRPRPLVLRANEGECVAVRFTNELDAQQGEGLPQNPRASIYVRGVPFDVQTSGGGHVGYNEDTSVGRGETITYYWQAPKEGTYFFNDSSTTAGSEADGGSLSAGLYGAFVVEPPGSIWTDPVSGDPLYTGTIDQSGELYIDAVISAPGQAPFRESVQLAQDELPVVGAFGFNYGSEDTEVRLANLCPDCTGEETSLSSWAYGDPSLLKLASGFGPWLPGSPEAAEDCGLGTDGFETDSCFTANVTHAYKGDQTKIRYGLAGVKETHVFHLHAHTWLADDQDVGQAGQNPTRPGPNNKAESPTIDSQTFGPMEMFTADLVYGAGSKNGTIGDSIFHCHLYPHFVKGFWGLLRVHDVREDGSGSTPDGINVHALLPLPDRSGPAAPSADNPGYPRFIPGEAGWRAPQPPLGITYKGDPEVRYVAGEPLVDGSPEVEREQAAMARLAGPNPKPGAPFGDPCPQGAREVTYKVSAIQTKVVYNERGDFDSQGRMLVLDRDVDAILSGRKAPEPLFVRVNAGDCINWELTNRMPHVFGNDVFQQLTQTSMFGQHIHLVKFDVMASDGASNGWNYQQAGFSDDLRTFNQQIAANPGSCTATKCRLDLPADHDPLTSSLDVEPGQTITERWFADYELRTVFTHDHHFAAVDQNRGQYGAVLVEPAGMDFRNPVTGAWYQPVNNPSHGAVCGSSCVGGAAGGSMDVIGPGVDDDFREFGLAVADFVPLIRGGGDPQNRADALNPPPAPEPYPDEDPGVMAINYRNAPLELREEKNGLAVDPAYAFSSHVFGDPMTPVLQSYSGDNVRIRLIQGSQEEQHTIHIHGVKWKKEPDDPQSHYIDTTTLGISEAFNFEVPRLGCAALADCRGDYLYSSTAVDDLWSGVWGIMRVNGGRVPHLLPLPDNVPGQSGSVPSQSPTAMAPPARQGAGQPCPQNAPVKKFDVVALQTEITYNDEGDHDPFGLVYALAQDEAAIRAGKNPEPLVLRANEGDCIEVTLRNTLTPDLQRHRGEGDARLPGLAVDAPRVPGLRVSMHASMLKYDVRGSDGAAIGFNRDQTVGPGQQMTYRWFADQVTPAEIGAVNLTDYGDVLGHRHHGLFAGLVVEPRGASWHDPMTGAPLASGTQADIRIPGQEDFRESVVFFQDGLNLRTADGSFIEDPIGPPHPPEEEAAEEPHEETLDPEDSGEKGFNYRNEPFRNRLGYEPASVLSPSATDMSQIYDSHSHGDPSTPMMRAYEDDRLQVRVMMAADKPRQHAFGLAGHQFKLSPQDPGSRHVGTMSGLGPHMAVNADMGRTNNAGDYLYGCEVGLFHRSGGLWGMLRVYPKPGAGSELRPTELTGVDDPRAGGHPILPLELDQTAVTVFEDTDHNGVRDAREPFVSDVQVDLTSSGQPVAGATSDAAGTAYLSARAGTYGLQVTPPEGLVVGSGPSSVTTTGNNDSRSVLVGLVDPSTAPTEALVAGRAFVDSDNDGVRDAGEGLVGGARLQLLQGGETKASGQTDVSGAVSLSVAPGAYTVSVTPPGGYVRGKVPGTVTTGPAGTTSTLWMPLRRPATRAYIRAETFFDRNNNGVKNNREPWVAKVRVSAVDDGRVVATRRTTRQGRAVLPVLSDRQYRLAVVPPRKFRVRSTPPLVRTGAGGSTRVVRIALVRRR